MMPTICVLFTIILVPITIAAPSASSSNCADAEDVVDGCQLITCTNGTRCGIRNGTAKFGNRPFESFLYPKCVQTDEELERNTDNDGNAHIESEGPGCEFIQCSQGYECQVRVSTSKLGDLPYAQSIGGFPQCVNATSSSYQDSSTIIAGGPGCEELAPCTDGTTCMVAVGIAKYGNLPFSQFFWPFCA